MDNIFDRFIYFNFEGIKKQILQGPEDPKNWENSIENERKKYFDAHSKGKRDAIKWNSPFSGPSDDNVYKIYQAIEKFYTIFTQEKLEEKWADLRKGIIDIMELACYQSNAILSTHAYSRLLSLSEQIIHCIFDTFGYTDDKIYEVLKKGVKNIDFNARIEFYSTTIDNTNATNRKKILMCLKDYRNTLAHNAFENDPTEAWRQLKYSLYDYITVVFFIMKHENMLKEKCNYIIPTITISIKHSHESKSIEDLVLLKDGKEIFPDTKSTDTDGTDNYTFTVERFATYCIKKGAMQSSPFSTGSNFYAGCVLETSEPITDNPQGPIELERLSGIHSSIWRQIAEYLNKFREQYREQIELIEKIFTSRNASQFEEALKEVAEEFQKTIEDKGSSESARNELAKKIRENLTKVVKDFAERLDKFELKIEKLLKEVDEQSSSSEEMLRMQHDLKSMLENMDSFDSKELEEYDEKLNSLSKEINERLDEIHTEVSEVKKTVDDVRDDVKNIKTENKKDKERKKLIGCVAAAIAVITVILCVFAKPIYDTTKLEMFCNIAHNLGNEDVAYEHARYLESKKELNGARIWYNNAKNRYREIIDKDSTRYEVAYRIAKMLVQLKGGDAKCHKRH